MDTTIDTNSARCRKKEGLYIALDDTDNSLKERARLGLPWSVDMCFRQVAMWRERNLRRVVLSFRGTSDILDVLTDVNLLQTPFEFREDGKKSDDPRMVHSGFFSSAKACNRLSSLPSGSGDCGAAGMLSMRAVSKQAKQTSC